MDIRQVFDTVWHGVLLYQIKRQLSDQLYFLFKYYPLSHRYFQGKANDTVNSYMSITSGAPQGSVLWAYLFLLYTADISTADRTLIATCADDMAIL